MSSDMMEDKALPTECYLEALVSFLDAIKYDEFENERIEYIETLRYTYSEAAKHFAQPLVQESLNVSPEKLEAGLRTCVLLLAGAWPKVSPQVRVDITIQYTYIVLMDDSRYDPHQDMGSFYDDLVHGRPQKNPWWRLMNDCLPKLLSHYGSFCAFSVLRSTYDFVQGCWIEQHNVHSFPGSYAFPVYVRRLSGLGQHVGGSLFPAEQFDEQVLLSEIATAIAQVEHVVCYVNDLMSSYKEHGERHDQTNLIRNRCRVEGISLNEALERLTYDTISACEEMLAVFEGRNSEIRATLEAFLHGYVTWHFCDIRYRIQEVYERTSDSPADSKFRHYYEHARSMGEVESDEWTVPSISELAQKVKSSGVLKLTE